MVAGQQAGWDLLERLHSEIETRGIPVLIVSTNSLLLEQAQAQADRYGSHRYLGKPFNLDEILAAIRDMIGDA